MKVHRIFRSLAMKLYILILVLVIPINLLVLFLSQMILQDYQDELRQSCDRWIGSFTELLDA